jgi:hypothetical protein
MSTIRQKAVVMAMVAMLAAGAAQAQSPSNSALVPTSASSNVVEPIVVGQTEVIIKVPVSALNSLRLQVIVPVDGAQISLIDPSGKVVIEPADPGISVLPGSALTPPVPGSSFLTPVVNKPVDGVWLLRAAFPAASSKTVALLTTFAESPFQVAMVLAGQNFRVNQPVALGMLVINQGSPVGGLTPQFVVSKDNVTLATLSGADNGNPADYDGKAGDGIYSNGYSFAAPGSYVVRAKVSIPTATGAVDREASGVINVLPANFTLSSVNGTITRGTGNCVDRLNVATSGSASAKGTYVTAITLKSPGGHTLTKRTSAVLSAPGAVNTSVAFSAAEIRTAMGEAGVFTVDPLDVVSFLSAQPWLELRKANAYSFPSLAYNDLCVAPVEIGANATVQSVLRSSYIGQLNFKLPIRVSTAGSYQVSFKVTDTAGKELGQFGLTQSFTSGVNYVNATVLSDKLQNSDGPFNIESVLAIGAGRTAQASRVPVSDSGFLRWQFFPIITGDLNADGSVNAADRDVVLQYRNKTALIPGDRRDINRDGKIDLLDAREVINRACTTSCPRN